MGQCCLHGPCRATTEIARNHVRCYSCGIQGAIHRTVLYVRPVDCNAVDHAKDKNSLEQVGVVGGSFAVYLFWPHRGLDLSDMSLLEKEHAQP